MTAFDTSPDKTRLEDGLKLTPHFDAQGLISCVVIDRASRTVLMLAHMNAEALALTLRTGEVHFYSRSRQALWKKGETSGNTLTLKALHVDCDQDALVAEVIVEGDGAACHTGAQSCFYRQIDLTEVSPTGNAAPLIDHRTKS